MPSAAVLIRNVGHDSASTEKISEFNARIAEACNDAYVTSARLEVIQDVPVVTLTADDVDDLPDDASAAQDPADGAVDDDLGEDLPSITAELVFLNLKNTPESPEEISKTEDRLADALERAGDGLTDLIFGEGKTKVFALVCYAKPEADEGK